MARALLMLGWLATAGVVATAILGFRVTPSGGVALHLLAGLLSSLLILFSHSWIMFYLIGTGKVIREAVSAHDLDRLSIERTREFKNRSYPWLLSAMVFIMATFIVGGGVATRVLPPWPHSVLFAAALLVQVRTLVLEGEVLLANERLMHRVEREIAERDVEPKAGRGD